MKIIKRVYWCIFPASFLLGALLQSCKEENAEDLFLGGQVEAKSYYLTNVLPILNSKCFSCHNYHSSSGTRYDTYAKAAAMAEEIANRTSSAHPNSMMPPPSANPLTDNEKKTLQQFLQLVKGGGENLNDEQKYGVSISWTAYKFPEYTRRVGVTGTFDKTYITYKKKEAANIYDFLNGAEILIPTNTANVGNDSLKSSNVINSFFSYFTPVIYGHVMAINSLSKRASVKITMNGFSQEVIFEIEEAGENLIFTGEVQDIGYFNANAALNALQRACGQYHQDKVWPDISLKAEIKNFRKFSSTPLK
ncbi:Rossmann-fold NAD(P)-binding domain-containing protein [Rufibacter tibetensis]|uniref:Cytochrome c domain-containing protein n=1 Tax=Rufibacter tibetensis TaxID=512763 RepID=A0A0P0CLF6_9BACT|nr:hypothetical protein [Rufibacter tibetensis]ALJ00460.1 hypothetical protein DC20_17650 [Rufibacter tibetensis]